jgi:type IV secretory pathway VirB2 component (pilin)
MLLFPCSHLRQASASAQASRPPLLLVRHQAAATAMGSGTEVSRVVLFVCGPRRDLALVLACVIDHAVAVLGNRGWYHGPAAVWVLR